MDARRAAPLCLEKELVSPFGRHASYRSLFREAQNTAATSFGGGNAGTPPDRDLVFPVQVIFQR